MFERQRAGSWLADLITLTSFFTREFPQAAVAGLLFVCIGNKRATVPPPAICLQDKRLVGPSAERRWEPAIGSSLPEESGTRGRRGHACVCPPLRWLAASSPGMGMGGSPGQEISEWTAAQARSH